MLEKGFLGGRKYWIWMACLLLFMGAGFISWLFQFREGLGITGMSRDISWGVYIANFTFLVGVAAAAVMVVLPYYVHHYKAFGRITILAEFLGVAAVTMCLLFILVDLGNPVRALNVILHPTPNSILFWDMVVLNGYLFLNIFIGWNVLTAERKGSPPPGWLKPFIYLSIPWAISIHTVTAFLYAGLPGRHFWLTAIMAARFLSSAFAAGPAMLILFCFIVRKTTKFNPGNEQIRTLSGIVTYAMILNVFFFLLECFTAFYSNIPGHMHTIVYLFRGLHGHTGLVPWMWVSAFFAVVSLVLLIVPAARRADDVLAVACVSVFIACWIDKGVGLVIGGFIPNPLEHITEYVATVPEVLITLGVWATGFFILSFLYKIAITVKEELRA
ncbi:MAG: polysulfide reductase NrfD [Deltaproteobacteria bacterium]|nr:polysulfide reductase NrfD [Deltaproteobacteria bacterium]RLB81048.1 MAG: menaquinol oxidoreductase [Deltaproteobacteria bacterium]